MLLLFQGSMKKQSLTFLTHFKDFAEGATQ
jgi:hypothetical protein